MEPQVLRGFTTHFCLRDSDNLSLPHGGLMPAPLNPMHLSLQRGLSVPGRGLCWDQSTRGSRLQIHRRGSCGSRWLSSCTSTCCCWRWCRHRRAPLPREERACRECACRKKPLCQQEFLSRTVPWAGACWEHLLTPDVREPVPERPVGSGKGARWGPREAPLAPGLLTCPERRGLPVLVVVGEACEARHAARVVVLQSFEQLAKFLLTLLLPQQPHLVFLLQPLPVGKRPHLSWPPHLGAS